MIFVSALAFGLQSNHYPQEESTLQICDAHPIILFFFSLSSFGCGFLVQQDLVSHGLSPGSRGRFPSTFPRSCFVPSPTTAWPHGESLELAQMAKLIS